MRYLGYKDDARAISLDLEQISGPDLDYCASIGKSLIAGRLDKSGEYLILCDNNNDVGSLYCMSCNWYRAKRLEF